ncbi:MAG: beta-phosphoglucomutase [Hungatella hathewayi]|nr:beta-phosphoglucomutase [Hungatella hathewayi]
MIKAFIFDLDGVLVHTDNFHYQAWKRIADQLGVYFDEDINNKLRGVSRMDSLNIILENYQGAPLSDLQKTELTEEKNKVYRAMLCTMGPNDVSEEVKETLKQLRKKGFLLSVGSSSKNARYILEKTGIESYFDAVSDGNNISKSKPHPEVFLTAAAYLGIPAISCAVVEDSRAGIDAAKSAGAIAIGMGDACGYDTTDIELGRFSDLIPIADGFMNERMKALHRNQEIKGDF